MKKLLLAAILLGMFWRAHAQGQSLFYYYKGQKFFVQQTYSRLSVGIKKVSSLTATRNSLAANLQLAADSVIPSATPGEYIIHLSASQQGNGRSLVQSMLNKSFITYVHPILVGQGSKLVSYGDAFTIKLKANTPLASLRSLLVKNHCSIVKQSPGDRNTYLISAGQFNNYDAIKTANLFFETGLFEYSQPDFTTHGGLAAAPNDPLYNLQWAHHNTGSEQQYNGTPGADMQVDSAWLITKGDTSIKIAVIDTGVDTVQADIKKNLLQGYSCVTQTASRGDGMPLDSTNAHGTACAGIIAAVANNKIGIAGIAPNCKIIPVSITNSYSQFASDFAISTGIDYSWQHGADILTNSWTIGLPSQAIDDAIHRAVTQGRGGKGCIVFFAAGNDDAGIAYPSSLSEVISVGGSNMCNQRKTKNSCDGEYWWGASYGGGLDVVAPCVKIPTTDISGSAGYDTAKGATGDYFLTFNGTSSATPHAAAVAALVLSVNKALTGANARTIVESNCTKGGNYTYAVTQGYFNGTWNNEMGYGIVNAYKSVLAAKNKKFCSAGIVTPATTTLCKNGFISLAVADSNATATYTWRLDGNNIKTGAFINAALPGIYDVVAEFANKCTAYAPPVYIHPADTAALLANAGKPVFTCTGNNGVIIGGEPSASGGTPIVAKQRAYGYDLLHGSFIRFSTDNPRDYTFIPVGALDGVTGTQFIAGDFTPTGYYAVTKGGVLARIDTATGYVRFIGQLIAESGQFYSHNWSGLAWDQVTKKLYGITSGGQADGLFDIDPVTGYCTRIAYVPNQYVSWGTFGGNGTMYVFSETYNNVSKYLINGTAPFFNTGDIGAKMLTQLDGSIDPLNGKLYLTTYAYAQDLFGDLREIDTTTAKITVKGSIGSIDEVAALAIAGGTYKYAWAPATGLSNPNDANPIAGPATTTTYTLTVTDACGAKATSQVVVTTNAPKPAIKITAAKDSICIGDSSRLVATKNPSYTYQWTFNGAIINNFDDSVYTAGRGGNIQVSVANGRGGCTNTSPVFKLKDCSIWLNNEKTDTTCYSYFYPPHGYTDTGFRPNESYTKTVYPANRADRLKITFNKFKGGTFTGLSIYDGPNTSGTLLKTMGFYDYLNQNVSYTSSTGPLTFKLTNGYQADNIGTWDAFLTCVTPHTYLSKNSGEFGDSSTWLVRTPGGGFANAETIPTYIDDSIIIRKGHTVSVSKYPWNAYVDQVWIQKGATLILNTGLPFIDAGKFSLLADGDIALQGQTQLSAPGEVHIRGNLSATVSNTAISSNLVVDGTVPQVFTLARKSSINALHLTNKKGLTIQGYTQVYNLYISSPGGLNADSMDIIKLLHLDTGIIHINSPGVVSLSEYGADYSPGNSKSYIDGAVARNISSYTGLATHYPIGTATQFRPLNLNFGQYIYDVYTARALNAPVPVQPLPAGINAVSNLSYYKVTSKLNAPINALTVTLPYLHGDGVTDPANLRIVRDSAGTWLSEGGVGTHKDTGSITSTLPITHVGNLALANATGGTNALPVTWLDFTAALQNNAVMLKWSIAQEINVGYYAVEHSADGVRFNTVTQMNAYNNAGKGAAYQYLHTNPVRGINYYRIKEIDKDGKYVYSKTINIQLSDKNNITVTPNPAKDVVTVTAADIIKEIYCYNATGQLVKKVALSSNTCVLQLKQFAGGIYTLKIVTASATFNRKVVKQ